MAYLLNALLLAGVAGAYPPFQPPTGWSKGSNGWNLKQFNNLVTFGDSYTDENGLGYLLSHNGTAPPTGTLLPESFDTPGGGRTWDRYVVQYTGQTVNGRWSPQMTLYDYAVSGAVCSNLITPRYLAAIHQDFPSVLEYEIPNFVADIKANNIATGKPFFSPSLTATDAIYAMWIGTNDIGVDAFFTDSQIPGKVLTDYVNCVYTALDQLYASGARYFVLLNLAPLQLSPLYGNASVGGVAASHYWVNKPANLTDVGEKMTEIVTTLNALYTFETAYDALIANRWPGANIALFDVNSLMTDIHNHPSVYLNGTGLPLSVTGFELHCALSGSPCNSLGSPDSFMWYDELHPSEQVDRVIAKEFVKVISGSSSYATYYAPTVSSYSGWW